MSDSDIINLLEETIQELSDNGKAPDDVLWVGNHKLHFSWNDFVKVAGFRYNNGYGGEKIDTSLVVVGEDWWLERWEYDGSEGWDFKTIPDKKTRRYKEPDIQDLVSRDFTSMRSLLRSCG